MVKASFWQEDEGQWHEIGQMVVNNGSMPEIQGELDWLDYGLAFPSSTLGKDITWAENAEEWMVAMSEAYAGTEVRIDIERSAPVVAQEHIPVVAGEHIPVLEKPISLPGIPSDVPAEQPETIKRDRGLLYALLGAPLVTMLFHSLIMLGISIPFGFVFVLVVGGAPSLESLSGAILFLVGIYALLSLFVYIKLLVRQYQKVVTRSKSTGVGISSILMTVIGIPSILLGVSIALAVPSFLSQQNAANISSHKQSMTVIYKDARAYAVDYDGKYQTSEALAQDVQASEPQYKIEPITSMTNPVRDVYYVQAQQGGSDLAIYTFTQDKKLEAFSTNGSALVFKELPLSEQEDSLLSDQNQSAETTEPPSNNPSNPVLNPAIAAQTSKAKQDITIAFKSYYAGTITETFATAEAAVASVKQSEPGISIAPFTSLEDVAKSPGTTFLELSSSEGAFYTPTTTSIVKGSFVPGQGFSLDFTELPLP